MRAAKYRERALYMRLNNFILDIRDGIAVLKINRPEVRNALTAECWQEISEFADLCDRDDSIKLAIFTGEGTKAFIAGADVGMIKERTAVSALQGTAQGALRKLEQCTKPTIAAVNGYAFGGGCEVAMACDIRYASENARFCLPELSLGILPGGGGTQRLAKLVGLGRAKEMILTGRTITAQEALSYGLVTKVTPLEELMDNCLETARTILSKGPLAIRLAKSVINMSMTTDQDAGMLLELLSYSILVGSEDKTEGVNAFIEKRPAKFTGK